MLLRNKLIVLYFVGNALIDEGLALYRKKMRIKSKESNKVTEFLWIFGGFSTKVTQKHHKNPTSFYKKTTKNHKKFMILCGFYVKFTKEWRRYVGIVGNWWPKCNIYRGLAEGRIVSFRYLSVWDNYYPY